MNGSSTLNNVLLASPAQPKVNALTQKGGDDADSPMDFKRAFDDVRSNQDVKSKEPCAKKITSADKRPKTKSDDSATADGATTPTEKPASQVAEKSTDNTDKDKSEDIVASDDTKKTDITDATESAPVIAVLNVPVPAEPVADAAVVTTVATDAVDADAVQNIEAPVVGNEAPVLTAGVAAEASFEMRGNFSKQLLNFKLIQ